MVERREDLRLTLEARHAVGIGGKRLRQHLQRDLADQDRIGGPVHLPHAASTEQAEYFVRAES